MKLPSLVTAAQALFNQHLLVRYNRCLGYTYISQKEYRLLDLIQTISLQKIAF